MKIIMLQSKLKLSKMKKNRPLSSAVSFQNFTGNETENLDFLPIELVFDSTPAKRAIDRENFENLKTTIKENLSKMELEVLKLYLQGYSYNEISQRLSLSNKTIDNSLMRIKTKLRAKLQEQKDI